MGYEPPERTRPPREKIHPNDLALIDAKQLYKLPKYKAEAEEAANG